MIKKQAVICCIASMSFINGAQNVANIPVTTTKTETVPVEIKKTEAPAMPMKMAMEPCIAIVDVQKLINETQVDKEYVEQLFEKQKTFQEELKKEGEKIQKKENEIKTKSATVSPDALKKLYEELDDMRVRLNRLAERRQKELQNEEMNTRLQVFQRIQGYTQEMLNKQGNIHIVCEKNSVLAYQPTIEKTDELVKVVKADLAAKEAASKKKAEGKKKAEVKPEAIKAAA